MLLRECLQEVRAAKGEGVPPLLSPRSDAGTPVATPSWPGALCPHGEFVDVAGVRDDTPGRTAAQSPQRVLPATATEPGQAG